MEAKAMDTQPMAVSYVSKLKAERTIVHLTAENEAGTRQHVFVACSEIRAAALLKAWREGTIREEAQLASYGEVVASEFGRFPSETVRAMLWVKFGVEV